MGFLVVINGPILKSASLYSLIINKKNTIFVNRRLLKVSKLNMPIVWDANIVGI